MALQHKVAINEERRWEEIRLQIRRYVRGHKAAEKSGEAGFDMYWSRKRHIWRWDVDWNEVE